MRRTSDTVGALRPGSLLAAALLILVTTCEAYGGGPQDAVFGIPPPNVSKLLEVGQKGADAYGKAEPLDDSNPDTEPDYDPPGMPGIPIECGSQDSDVAEEDCAACYEEAQKKLRKLRINFEQLRILYSETDDFTKASLAFGDSIAGSVGVGALQWTAERMRISNSFKQFKKAYGKKYEELLGKLDETLHEIADCEEKYFGDADWYNRYGFIFQSFMALHYSRR